MRITSGQLVRLIMLIHERYAGGPYNLNNPATIAELIRRDFPEVTSVAPPPTFEEVRRRYAARFWASYTVPSFEVEPGPTIRPMTREQIEYNQRMAALYHGAPPPSPAERMLSELDLLRSNPMGALTYVTLRACDYNNAEAMGYARVAGGLWDIVAAATPAPVSDVSGRAEPSSVPPEFTPDYIAGRLDSL